MNFKIGTLAQHPDYAEQFATFHLQTGPDFLCHTEEYHRNIWMLHKI